MLRKSLVICGLLLVALAVWAQAQSGSSFTGKVAMTGTQVVGGKFNIVLRLAEYPHHTFLIDLEDAPKFGLTRDKEIRSGDEFGQFMGAAEALKGKTVKLTGVKMEDSGPSDYQVKALERFWRD